MTPENVKAFADKILFIAALLAKVTPTEIDDKIVDFLKAGVADPTVLAILVTLINMMNMKKSSGGPAHLTKEDIVAAIMAQ